MESKTIKWKIMFFAMLGIVIVSIFDAATIPDVIAPTHPMILSLSLFVFDSIVLLGSYNYAFRKKIIEVKLVWQLSLFSFYLVNILAVGFELYNRADGYETYDMIHVVIIKMFIVALMSYPTYLYYKNDLNMATS